MSTCPHEVVGADLGVRPEVLDQRSNMPYDPRIHDRRSIRFPRYDYSQTGAYFITIVTQGRECLFGHILDGEMRLNAAGELVTDWWRRLSNKFPLTFVDAFVVMPNHFHGIIVIEGDGQTHGSAPTGPGESVGADLRVRPDQPDLRVGPGQDRVRPDQVRVHPNAPISQMVQWLKTMTTNAYIHGVNESGWAPFNGRLWQRNYYEHVIRNAADHQRICNYIESNPWRWTDDEENPAKA